MVIAIDRLVMEDDAETNMGSHVNVEGKEHPGRELKGKWSEVEVCLAMLKEQKED